MARPLRIQYPGAYYHVMNRVNRRQMAMEISYRYSNEKQAEIGAVFGVDYSTVSRSRSRLKAKLKSNRKLNKKFKQIK